MKTQKPLPNPPVEYNQGYMYDLSSLIIQEESVQVKVDRDNVFTEIGSIILKDTANGNFYKLKVTNGTLGVTVVEEDSKGFPVTTTNPYV